MILNKTKEFLLVGKISTQVKAKALWVVVFKPVIERLVVTHVESLLVKLPLQAPIGFGNEEEAGMRLLDGGDYIDPVLACRPLTRACAPGALEDRIQQKHRHIEANTVTLTGDS